MYKLLLVSLFVTSTILIIIIMLQYGKNTDVGRSSFESNPSNILFSTNNSSNLITYITIILAIFFFILSLALDNINIKNNNISKEMDDKSLNEQTRVKNIDVVSSDIPR